MIWICFIKAKKKKKTGDSNEISIKRLTFLLLIIEINKL